MFEQPEAKRIKRSNYGKGTSSSPEASPSPSTQEETSHSRYEFEYEFIDVPTISKTKPGLEESNTATQKPESGAEDDQTFEFRLFASEEATSTNATESKSHTKTTVTLVPEQDLSQIPLSEGRFLKPARPDTYYFTSSLSRSDLKILRKRYEASAVSTSDLLQIATSQHWPGTALPWRVIHLTAPGKKSTEHSRLGSQEQLRAGRSKPNKKRRIQLRKLLLARTAAANAKAREHETAEEKEKAMREKKTAKNRKVQLKRREKERLKKAQAQVADDRTAGVIEETEKRQLEAGENVDDSDSEEEESRTKSIIR